MKINQADHPSVRVEMGTDGLVHAFDTFGSPWCEERTHEDEVPESDGPASEPTDPGAWCPWCFDEAKDEGVVTP